MTPAEVARQACIWEVSARKLGNVHPGARFHDLDHLDFLRSADALAATLQTGFELGIGELILRAVQARRGVTPSNTNLGIILLLVPLAKSGSRDQLQSVLSDLSVDDARFAFEAIRLASAGGLGEVPDQSVNDEPTSTLLEAMRLAADRDAIARQYATGFADIFDFGVPKLMEGFHKHGCIEGAILHSQLQWLAAYPDSLIARKNGVEIAETIRRRASAILSGQQLLRGFDADLRRDGNRLNPGTTADLITASLFVAIREGKLKTTDPFDWVTDEWL